MTSSGKPSFGTAARPPFALFANPRPRIGPSAVDGAAMNALIMPMNGIALVAMVLPIGVRQQLAYQRIIPFGERRMAATLSALAVNTTFACDICVISVPP